jgi:XTP/dITP diphosphohydrolase
MKKMVFASSNPGKIKELRSLLEHFAIQVVPQTELNVSDADETGLTFVENALLKARNACAATGLPALADDSGLTVDALQGAPGIYSARYAGANADSDANIKKLLAAMKDIPAAQRGASFQCVLVYLSHALDPVPLICHGVWSGQILETAQGENGFGYDPVFWVAAQNCSAAQLPQDIKNQLSHRGQALRKLMSGLAEKMSAPETGK